MEKQNTLTKIPSHQIEDQLKQLRGELVIPQQTYYEPDLPLHKSYLHSAAVLVCFDPDSLATLKNLAETERQLAIRELIGMSELMVEPLKKNQFNNSDSTDDEEPQLLYYLRDEVRMRILEQLVIQGQYVKAIEVNKPIVDRQTNLLQQTLTDCLSNKVPSPLSALNLDELTALHRVSAWLGKVGLTLGVPTPDQISYQIAKVEMLRPFKHLTGRYQEGKFTEYFRGREAERTKLRNYVGVAPTQGTLEAIRRFYQDNFEPIVSLNKRPPLLIFGPGGVGKSSLIAKFILEHAEAHQKRRFPFVYLDFDRPSLSAIDPETLLVEAARQLSIQYASDRDLSEAFQLFHENWKNQLQLLSNTSSDIVTLRLDGHSQQVQNHRVTMATEFTDLMGRLFRREPRPFLLVVDTFEEVQYKGREYVEELYQFLNQLQVQYPQLRTVLSGRAAISEFKTEPIEVGDLDPDAAQGCLLKMGISNAANAKLIADKVGGNPLNLKLAAELVKSAGMENFKKVRVTEKQFLLFEQRFPEREIQGILYERILNHIHTEEIRKLAHPGLVLREITPELIQKVLAEPCGLKVSSLEEAKRLFAELGREVSLVSFTDASTLRHRPDVRKSMLKLLCQSLPLIVEDIHHRAANYYKTRNKLSEKAEGFYHLLALDSPREVLEHHWQDGFQSFLMGSLDELSVHAQAYLFGRTGTEPAEPGFWETADTADLERWLTHRTADLMNSGLADKALSLLDRYVERTNSPLLSLFRAKALSILGRHKESKDTAEEALMKHSPETIAVQIETELNEYYKDGQQRTSKDIEVDGDTLLWDNGTKLAEGNSREPNSSWDDSDQTSYIL